MQMDKHIFISYPKDEVNGEMKIYKQGHLVDI
jgi:hypothetical protein